LLEAVIEHRGHKGTEVHKGLKPNDVSYRVIGAAMKVHNALGPGVLESAYNLCLCHQFARDGLHFQHQIRFRSSTAASNCRLPTASISSSRNASS